MNHYYLTMLGTFGQRVPAIWSLISLLLCLVGVTPLAAENPQVVAVRFAASPEIDGLLDDPVWRSAEPVEGFTQVEPSYGELSPFRTVVLVGYTTDTLFVGFRCFDHESLTRLSAAVLTRDGELEHDDSVSVLLDPFNDHRTAYFFSTNLNGVQRDGKVADNGRTIDSKWDASWSSAASRSPEGWTAELAIPFEVLKYPSGASVWGVNFHRNVPRRLETAVWSGPEESEWRVSSFGALTGLDLQPRLHKRFKIIPYGIFEVEEDQGSDWQVGVDLRYRIKSGLSADLTVNPDFALVEADVEKVNLTRFELFVPEKRPFFLEGLEMFDQRIRQFYSRRIGDISWGGKLTGKLAGWDLAALVTDTDLDLGDPAENVRSVGAAYSVLRAQRGVFGASTVGLLATNRSMQGQNLGSVGLDASLFFTETLGMTAQVIRAHGPENDGAMAWFLRPAYDSANTHFHVRYTNLDVGLLDNINAVGFLVDDDRREYDTNITHTVWFKDSWVEKIEGYINYNRYESQEGVLRSWVLDGEIELVLRNRWHVEVYKIEEFKLYEKEFRNSVTQVEVGFNDRAGKSFDLVAGAGTNYDSDLKLAGFDLALNLSEKWNLWYEGTWLELDPDPGDESTWIHVLGANYYMTKDLYLKLFFQSNSAIDKENIQALLVWRFLPPFGSLQVAYQRGTSALGAQSEQGDSLFTKLSWVF